MIRNLACLILVFISFPVIAAAQTVGIRSGEHADFTRLVLTLPKRLPWTLEQEGRTATLKFESDPLEFDTSAVFQRISGKRLADLSIAQGGQAIDLTLACECEVSGFWHTWTMLVLDIADTGPARSAHRPVVRDRSQVTGTLPETQSTAAKLVTGSLPPYAGPAAPPHKANDEVDRSQALTTARDRLMQQFGRAATQGLLSPKGTGGSLAPAMSDDVEEAKPEPAVPIENDSDHAGEPVASQHINLQAQSSIDEALLSMLDKDIAPDRDAHCIPDDMLDVAAWAADAPFWIQVGPLRSSMTAEFDKIKTETAVQLAKLYIHYGFGAEALQILRLVQDGRNDLAPLKSMASILKDRRDRPDGFFNGMYACPSRAALWALLSSPDLPQDADVNEDAALLAFNALPVHLRKYLGPRLVRLYLDADDKETADRFLRAMTRDPLPDPPETALVQAAFDHANGDDKAAISSLEGVIETGAEPSAEALVKLVEVKHGRQEPLSFEIAQLAAAYAVQNRNAPIGPELIWAQIIALAGSGVFDDAIRLLNEFENALPEHRAATRADVMALLTDSADDVVFLRHMMAGNTGAVSNLPTGIGNAIAARLLDLGFPDAAQHFALPAASQEGRRERQILRARIALRQKLPRKAEVELLGLVGDDVNILRAQARSVAGEHAIAGNLYRSAEQPDAALREYWLAEDWHALAGSDDPVLAELGQLLSKTDSDAGENTDLDDSKVPVLERNRSLLKDSTDMRQTIQGLLEVKSQPVVDPD